MTTSVWTRGTGELKARCLTTVSTSRNLAIDAARVVNDFVRAAYRRTRRFTVLASDRFADVLGANLIIAGGRATML